MPRLLRVHPALDPLNGGIVSSLLATSAALAPTHSVQLCTRDSNRAHHAPFERVGATVISASRRNLINAVHDADLVTIEGAWNRLAPLTAAAASRRGVPYIYVPHGSLSQHVRKQYPSAHRKKLAYWVAVERHIASHAAAVWFSSTAERDNCVPTFSLARGAHNVVVPFTSQDFGVLGRTPPTGRPLRLLVAARVTPVKDIDVLIRTISLSSTWELTVAGKEDNTYSSSLRRLARQLGVDRRVRWRGFLAHHELVTEMARADLYICPGLESFGMSVAEALSTNLPVVASDAAALAPFLREAGRIFPRGDHLALHDAIESAGEQLRASGFGETPRQAWERACSAQSFRSAFESRILARISD